MSPSSRHIIDLPSHHVPPPSPPHVPKHLLQRQHPETAELRAWERISSRTPISRPHPNTTRAGIQGHTQGYTVTRRDTVIRRDTEHTQGNSHTQETESRRGYRVASRDTVTRNATVTRRDTELHAGIESPASIPSHKRGNKSHAGTRQVLE